MLIKNVKLFTLLFSILSIVILSCNKNESRIEVPFKVLVFDSDYSLAYTFKYELNNDEIKVTFSGQVEGEVDSIIYQRKLSTEEKQNAREFFSEFPLTELKDEYITPNIDDGDQKLFEFEIGDFKKKIRASNYYEENLGKMVSFLNTLIIDKHKINYVGIH